MTYVSPNFKTKKALKEAVAAGQTIAVFQPGMGTVPENGSVGLEGPHYPEPHRWYAEGTMSDGKLVKVVSLLMVCCGLVTSAGGSMLLTEVYTTWPAASGEFSVGTSPSHELTVPVDLSYTQFDFNSSSAAGLTADLTNGVEDMLTFSFDNQSISRPEDFFRTSGLDDPRHFSAMPWLSTVDYHGMRLDSYRVTTDRAGSLIVFDVYGGVIEPPTIVLLLCAVPVILFERKMS